MNFLLNSLNMADRMLIATGDVAIKAAIEFDRLLIFTGDATLSTAKPLVMSTCMFGPMQLSYDYITTPNEPSVCDEHVEIAMALPAKPLRTVSAFSEIEVPKLEALVMLEVPLEKVVIESRFTKVPLEPLPDEKLRRKNRIERYAETVFQEEYDLPEGLATAMLRFESRTGDLMLSPTGCKGWYQFCSRTARSYNLNNPHDLVEATDKAAELASDNRSSLNILKLNTSAFHIYLSHVIGPGNSKTLMVARRGGTVTKKARAKLVRAMRPNWYKKTMGKRPADIAIASSKFYSFFRKKFNKLKSI